MLFSPLHNPSYRHTPSLNHWPSDQHEHFHHFVYLPAEVRRYTWTLALRPEHPGVNIFRIYDVRDDCTEAHAMASSGAGYISQKLAAPKIPKSIDKTQERNNISTYLIDGGLWLACKESRSIIDDHFQQSKWDTQRKQRAKDQLDWVIGDRYIPPRNDDVSHMPATGYFVDEPPQYFTVFPHRDLFILQADSLGTIDWSEFCTNIPLGSKSKGFGGIRHFGIEYNPEWGVQMQQAEYVEDTEIAQTFFRAALDIEDSDCIIYIVDYHLKGTLPLEECDTSISSSAVFYASDRKLVEVETDWFSMEKRRSIEPVDDDTRAYWSSSVEFVQGLCSKIDESGTDDSEIIESGMFFNCSFMLLGTDSL